MKLYDMIQVYSSGSTVIMNMHCIWPVLHMTLCLVAINKNRDMCFDMKNGKKKTYFSGEIPVNDCRNVWRGLKSIRLILKKKIRISKVSCKESSRSESLTGGNWQKWKRVFLTCPCHKIYRDEAVGLKSNCCKYTWKITKFVKMGNLGQYRENLIFCQ